MSGSDEAKRAWVERVLGLRSAAGPGASADPLDLTGRLRSAGNALRDAAAPEAAGLAVRYAELVGAAKTGPAGTGASLDALERDIARATSAARAREATPANGRGVAYRKLLLRWREAQATFAANLNTLGANLLGRPDIQADPRLEEIREAVAALPKLVPTFGGNLEDVLDAGMNAVDPAELAHLATEGIKAVDAYRQQLAAAPHLLELEAFASNDMGASLKLHGELDQALVELGQHLAA
jgi:hypothetical protein